MRRNEVPKQYKWQIAGAMFVTGRKWWDFVSYDPRIPNTANAIHVIRVHRDEQDMDELEEKLMAFDAMLKKEIERRVDRTL